MLTISCSNRALLAMQVSRVTTLQKLAPSTLRLSRLRKVFICRSIKVDRLKSYQSVLGCGSMVMAVWAIVLTGVL